MSSILKALKKAEEARVADQPAAKPPEKQFYVDTASPRTNPLIVIVCIAIIAVAGAYFLYVRTMGRTTAPADMAMPQKRSGDPRGMDRPVRNAVIAASEINAADLIREGRYAEAEVALKKAIEMHPDNAEMHNNLGMAMRKQNRLKEASTEYGIALKLKPDYPEALNNLGVVIGIEGDRKKAAELYKKAIMIKPDYADAHLNLGLLLEAAGDSKGARPHLRKFLALGSDPALKKQLEKHLSVGDQ